jgi:hypothetical protein
MPYINHKPLKTDKHVVVEPCKRCRRCPVAIYGDMEVLCWAIASPCFEVQEPLQNMYSMLPHKLNIVATPGILL